MFANAINPAMMYSNIGMETGVTSVSPNKLIIMLYDGAITSCNIAIGYVNSQDSDYQDIEAKSAHITKAINIIQGGLAYSLNKEAGGEIAKNLDALYSYMVQRLYTANIRNDVGAIQEVVKLLVELKGAWESIEPSYQAAAA